MPVPDVVCPVPVLLRIRHTELVRGVNRDMSSLVAAEDAESDEDDVPLLVPVDAEPPAEEAVRSDAVTDKFASTQGKEQQKVVPVTIITGCLGAGKVHKHGWILP